MRVQSTTESYFRPNQMNRKQVAFSATPAGILQKVDTAKICPGKSRLLRNVAEFFDSLQEKLPTIADAPKNYVYKLGEKNEIPESLMDIETAGLTLKRVDDALNTNPFKCSPNSNCGCGAGMTKGELIKKLFNAIGVEEPDFIKISAN